MEKSEGEMAKATAKVSVVVPIYTAERYLRQCLDRIVGQTLRELEIIMVDDGSSDGSSAIVDEYAARDGRIVAIHQPNGGMGKAYNVGIAILLFTSPLPSSGKDIDGYALFPALLREFLSFAFIRHRPTGPTFRSRQVNPARRGHQPGNERGVNPAEANKNSARPEHCLDLYALFQ